MVKPITNTLDPFPFVDLLSMTWLCDSIYDQRVQSQGQKFPLFTSSHLTLTFFLFCQWKNPYPVTHKNRIKQNRLSLSLYWYIVWSMTMTMDRGRIEWVMMIIIIIICNHIMGLNVELVRLQHCGAYVILLCYIHSHNILDHHHFEPKKKKWHVSIFCSVLFCLYRNQ